METKTNKEKRKSYGLLAVGAVLLIAGILFAIPALLKVGRGALEQIGSYIKAGGMERAVVYFGKPERLSSFRPLSERRWRRKSRRWKRKWAR